jgi:hypothetical protein
MTTGEIYKRVWTIKDRFKEFIEKKESDRFFSVWDEVVFYPVISEMKKDFEPFMNYSKWQNNRNPQDSTDLYEARAVWISEIIKRLEKWLGGSS